MARTAQRTAVAPLETLWPVGDWLAQCVEGFLRAQRLQIQAFELQSEIVRRAQAQATAAGNRLWDEWVARWGGGAPIDV